MVLCCSQLEGHWWVVCSECCFVSEGLCFMWISLNGICKIFECEADLYSVRTTLYRYPCCSISVILLYTKVHVLLFYFVKSRSFLSVVYVVIFFCSRTFWGGQRSKASKRHDAWLSNTVIVTKTMLVHVSKYTMLSFWLVLFCVELNAWSYFSSCYLKSSDFFYFAFQTLCCNKMK